jgi:tetratricopeptide (TPR) repeat protein
LRKDPNNLAGAHHWLNLAMELNQSKEMAARVANRKSCDWMSVDIKKAAEYLIQAIEIRQSFPKDEQDPFLVANLNSRLAGFLQKDGNLEAANKTIDLALEYSAVCRGERDPITDKIKDPTHDHQYFGLYDFKKAQIQLKMGNKEEALKFANRAIETFEHHKQDSADMLADALKLKEECSK